MEKFSAISPMRSRTAELAEAHHRYRAGTDDAAARIDAKKAGSKFPMMSSNCLRPADVAPT